MVHLIRLVVMLGRQKEICDSPWAVGNRHRAGQITLRANSDSMGLLCAQVELGTQVSFFSTLLNP